jgi:curved DNA-binding protein CbpA
MNYYVVLGIPEDADEETTRRAFRALVRRYHPDAGAGSSAAKFREIVDAYETLRDPMRRASYDSSLRAARNRARQAPVEPIRVESLRAEPVAEPLGTRFRSRPSYFEMDFVSDDVFLTDAIEELFAQILHEGFPKDFFFVRRF